MKTIIIVAVLALLPTMCLGENPDSRPSIYFGIGGYTSSGNYSRRGLDQDTGGQNFGLGVSFRIPTSENLTFNFGLGFDDNKYEAKENFFYYRSVSNGQVFSFHAGLKIYIGESINK